MSPLRAPAPSRSEGAGSKKRRCGTLGAHCIPSTQPWKLRQADDAQGLPNASLRSSNPDERGRPALQVIVGRRGPARLAPTEFHKESLLARAPLTLTGAGGDSGSRRLRLRAEAGSGA